MVDSGSSHTCLPTMVCHKNSPIQPLSADNGPQLRTVTNNEIRLYGYKWVYWCTMQKDNYKIVIPFYVCDVHQPIISVSRLERTRPWSLHSIKEQRHDHTPQEVSAQHWSKQQSLYYLRQQSFQFQQTTSYRYWANIRRNNSNDSTNYTDTTEDWNQSGRKQWFLDVQQWRILSTSTQDKEEGTISAIQDMNVQYAVDKLENYQKDNSETDLTRTMRTLKNNFRACQQVTTKESPGRTSWTGETWFRVKKAPKSNKQLQQSRTTSRQQTSSKILRAQATTRSTNRHQLTQTHRFTTRHQQAHNWKPPQQASQHHCQHHPHNGQQKTIGYREGTCGNESTYNHAMRFVHTTTDTTMDLTLQDCSNLSEIYIHEIHKMEQGWQGLMINGHHKTRRMTDKTWTGSTNFEEQVNIQGRVHHRWRGQSTSSIASKGIKAPQQPTEQERMRTQFDALTIQIMVFNLRGKGKGRATITQHKRQAQCQSYNVTLHTSRASMTNKSYQYLQQLT